MQNGGHLMVKSLSDTGFIFSIFAPDSVLIIVPPKPEALLGTHIVNVSVNSGNFHVYQ